jgi:hypothetical protein
MRVNPDQVRNLLSCVQESSVCADSMKCMPAFLPRQTWVK